MTNAVPVSIPRWQWRTVAPDLSWLFRRLPAPLRGPGRRTEETHLVCLHSSHSAVLRGERLEVRWRKERAAEGFELWDTILDLSLPFRAAELERLWAAWELPHPELKPEYPTIASFLGGAIAADLRVIPIRLTRDSREASFQGLACSAETFEISRRARFQSFSIEHEDPSLMAALLADLDLDAGQNINLLQGLKSALGLQAPAAGTQTWPAKSNASTS